jgi:hypothetical protein
MKKTNAWQIWNNPTTQVKKMMFWYYLGLKIMYEDNVHEIPAKSNKRILWSKNLQLCITPLRMCKK